MALAVHVPGDGRVRGADIVTAGGACGGASVRLDVLAHGTFDDHTADEVVILVLIGIGVDDGEHLGLDADLGGGAGELDVAVFVGAAIHVAEDAIVEGGLVLERSVAGTHVGVGPVDLVGLADLHVLAVLPIVLGGVDGVARVVVAAAKGGLLGKFIASKKAAVGVAGVIVIGPRARGVELADGQVLGAEMPVHVDGAEASLCEGGQDGSGIGVQAAHVARSHVATSLLDIEFGARRVVKGTGGGLGAGAVVLGERLALELVLEGGISHADGNRATDDRTGGGVADQLADGGRLGLGVLDGGVDFDDGGHVGVGVWRERCAARAGARRDVPAYVGVTVKNVSTTDTFGGHPFRHHHEYESLIFVMDAYK